ncbi:hypothetical protein [uncultured Massilia sp.]|uniref:hypothetical protein n=1 Tax=uncultured Massilia sp. TaxID=169973 RepID=UPI0025D0D2F7|nr:hypothetical protein [uncultured Massilia sp.]
MRANFAIEDMHAQTDDLDLQQRYIDGDITLADMLAQAHNFARRLANANSPGRLANRHCPPAKA